MKKGQKALRVVNEWDKLREVMVGLEDNTMAPDYMPEMDWMDPEQIEIMEKQAGKMTADIRPDMTQALWEQPDRSSTAGPLEPRTYSPNKSRPYSQWDLSSAFPTMRRRGE